MAYRAYTGAVAECADRAQFGTEAARHEHSRTHGRFHQIAVRDNGLSE